jgi:hypothetical protein
MQVVMIDVLIDMQVVMIDVLIDMQVVMIDVLIDADLKIKIFWLQHFVFILYHYVNSQWLTPRCIGPVSL